MANLLASYLDASGESDASFARRIRGSRSGVCRYKQGLRKPGRDLALRIEEATGGAVPAKSWAAPVASVAPPSAPQPA